LRFVMTLSVFCARSRAMFGLGERLVGIPQAAPTLPAPNKKRYKGNRN